MLLPRIYRLPTLNVSHCTCSYRRYSDGATTKYSRKVRAFPFKMSPQDAIIYAGPYASAACMFKGIVGSLGARFLPGFGFNPIRPIRIEPVYFPAWIIDGEVEAMASMSSDGETEQRIATAFFSNSYMPGFAFKLLSMISLGSDALYRHDPVPFSQELENQYGAGILCLPYTISPLSLLELIHPSSYNQATASESLRFLPTSVKPNLLAAYPVLIPLYLAQYEFSLLDDVIQSMTVVIEAYSDKGRVITEKTSAEVGRRIREITPNAPHVLKKFTYLMDEVGFEIARGENAPFARVDRFIAPIRSDRFASELGRWLDRLISSPGAAEKLVSKRLVDMDADPRIREFTADETQSNRLWMSLSVEIATAKTILHAMESANSSAHIEVLGTRDPADAKKLTDNMTRSLKENVRQLELRRRGTKPSWWKEWEDSQIDNSKTQK